MPEFSEMLDAAGGHLELALTAMLRAAADAGHPGLASEIGGAELVAIIMVAEGHASIDVVRGNPNEPADPAESSATPVRMVFAVDTAGYSYVVVREPGYEPEVARLLAAGLDGQEPAALTRFLQRITDTDPTRPEGS